MSAYKTATEFRIRKEGKKRNTYCSRLLNAILASGVSDDDSYKIVECSRVRRSNARSEPSAPTETKISAERGNHDLVVSAYQPSTETAEVHCELSWKLILTDHIPPYHVL